LIISFSVGLKVNGTLMIRVVGQKFSRNHFLGDSTNAASVRRYVNSHNSNFELEGNIGDE
jgi:hypothetical protein